MNATPVSDSIRANNQPETRLPTESLSHIQPSPWAEHEWFTTNILLKQQISKRPFLRNQDVA